MIWQKDAPEYDPGKAYDFQTPVPVCRYMVSLLPEGITTVCEPTPGRGNLVGILLQAGYSVTAPPNFWDVIDQRYDAVVCNLPFSKNTFRDLPDKFKALKSMEVFYKAMGYVLAMSDNVIALVPWFMLIDSDKRMKSLFRYGMISVTCLPRSTFPNIRVQTCVLQLQKGYTGPSLFKSR